jgi:hypothetical protein
VSDLNGSKQMKFRTYTTLLIALIVIGLSVLGDSAVANVAETGHLARRPAAQAGSEPLKIGYEPEPPSPKLLARNTVETRPPSGDEASNGTFDGSNGPTRQPSGTQDHRPRGYLGLIVFGSFLFGTACYLRREKSAEETPAVRERAISPPN